MLMRWLIVAVVLGVSVSCTVRREYVPMETVRVSEASDSIEFWMRQLVMQQLSVREFESVRSELVRQERVVVNEQGDTLRHDTHERESTDRTFELERENRLLQSQVDSLRRVKERCDTVDRPVPYPVKERVEVERGLHWWQKLLMWLGGVSVILVYVFIRMRIWKR